MSKPLPELEIENVQDRIPLDLDRIREAALRALPLCIGVPGSDHPVEGGALISCSLLDDAAIADVHGRYLGDPTPTDVITFPYGEILLSAETAAREAAARSIPIEQEIARYLIHGLLHLCGYNDTTGAAARRMHARQETILASVSP